jgi:ankyrin repeat protein
MTAPVGTGVFTVESDRAKLADVVEQVIDTTLETARTQGDLFIFRWFLAARHFYLKGLPAVKYAEDELSTWEDFRAAYAFETPHDDDRGYTPLRYAALSNNVAVVRELIEVHGADIHLQASKEAVPLFGTLGGEDILGSVMQICGGHKDAKPMIALLLSKGADPHRPSSGAGHGLVVAASFGNVDAATALLKLAPSMREGVPTMPFLFTPLNMACINNKSDFVQWLIENDLATDTCNLFGHAAFHASALQGDVDCMRLMVTCLKHVCGARMQDSWLLGCLAAWLLRPWLLGCGPLAASLLGSSSDVCCLYGRLKENINIISTPQRFLPANLIHNVTKVAYRCGVRARPVTWFSESIFATPLHCAANSNRISVLAYLLSAGADPTVLNGVGHTAIETARRHGHRDAAAIIEAWPNAPTQGRFDVGSGLPSAPTEGRNTREKVTDTLDLSC